MLAAAPFLSWEALRRYRSSISHLAILLADAVVLLSVLFSVSAHPQPGFHLLTGPQAQAVASGGWFEVAIVAMVASLHSYGHYRRRQPFWTEAGQVAAASLIGLICSLLVMQIMGDPGKRLRLFLLIVWICIPPAIIIMRQLVRSLLSAAGLWQIRALVAGDPAHTAEVTRALLSDSSLGYRLAGGVGIEMLAENGVRAALANASADFLVIAPSGPEETAHLLRISADLALGGVPFAVVPTQVTGAPVACSESQYFMNSNLMFVACGNRLDRPMARLAKHAFDVAVASLLLLILAPIFLVIALLVKLDGGPAFFAHKRMGANGRRFACLKFRTMAVDADAALQKALAADPGLAAEWTATRKLRHDPRITRIGRFLRSTSLDELPQLINVLRGEMSLVGPRPIVEAEIAHYGEAIDFYYRIKPGVTGLWQVSGRSNTSYPQRVEMDIWYVKNWTLWHDIAIMFKTVTAVLGRDGAV